jgi:hypothetical protein
VIEFFYLSLSSEEYIAVGFGITVEEFEGGDHGVEGFT